MLRIKVGLSTFGFNAITSDCLKVTKKSKTKNGFNVKNRFKTLLFNRGNCT